MISKSHIKEPFWESIYFANHATLFKINLLAFLCMFENTDKCPCFKDNNYVTGSSKF